MKICFNSASLLQIVSVASRTLNSKNSMPILDCIRMKVLPDHAHVIITASDMENTTTSVCDIISYDPDEDPTKDCLCVRTKLLIDVLKEIPEQPVTLTVNMQTMEITGEYANGQGRFAIVGEQADAYPMPPELTDGREIIVPATKLVEAVNQTLYATSDDVVRPVMTGVCLDFTAKGLVAVGTNGKVLVRYTLSAVKTDNPVGLILSKKTAGLIRNLLGKADQDVKVAFNSTHVYVEIDGCWIMSRLIDGRYPNYNSVIPVDNPVRATIMRSQLVPALRRVLTFANQDSSLVKMEFADGTLTLSSQDVDYSMSASEEVPCSLTGADSFTIGMKGNLMLEALAHMQEEIYFEMSRPDHAIVCVPMEHQPDADQLTLLMPMVLN